MTCKCGGAAECTRYVESCLRESRDTGDCFLLDGRIVPEARKPSHFWLPAKPGHLPLGVVAVCLLRRYQRLFGGDLTSQKLGGLFVAEG